MRSKAPLPPKHVFCCCASYLLCCCLLSQLLLQLCYLSGRLLLAGTCGLIKLCRHKVSRPCKCNRVYASGMSAGLLAGTCGLIELRRYEVSGPCRCNVCNGL
jgi:hypothetical protein